MNGQFVKGQTPWNKGLHIYLGGGVKKGNVPWNKGIKTGQVPKTAFKKGQSPWNKNLKGYKAGKKHWCWGKNRLDMTGENNFNWKGGITSVNKIQRYIFRKSIRKQVLERDNYTCQNCGQVGGKLHVDHIQRWSEYVRGRFSINNCRTLCRKCHYELSFGKPIPDNSRWGMYYKEDQLCKMD